MRVFVTGATGLLGNNLVRSLEGEGHEVVALVRDEARAASLLSGVRATLVRGDLREVDAFAPSLRGVDAVFHAGAQVRAGFGSAADEEALERVNVRATLALLDAAEAAGAKVFVHVGSGGTVGRREDGGPGDESTPPSPFQRANPYLRSKLLGAEALASRRGRGVTAVVEVLPGWIWGPWDAAPTAAGALVAEHLARRIPMVVDGGTMIVDARDVAFAMVAAATRALHGAATATGGVASREAAGRDAVERYVVGGHFLTMKEILGLLEEATGVPGPRVTAPHAALLAWSFLEVALARFSRREPLVTPAAVRLLHARIALDSSKAERSLGLRLRDPSETFRDTVEWLLARASNDDGPRRVRDEGRR